MLATTLGENMILAHIKGLLTACSVKKREGQRVFVKVQDEKRPKWIDLSLGKHKLFHDVTEACDWVYENNPDPKKKRKK